MRTFDFRTLGSIDLRPSDGGPSASILTQPKRLAFLAYLVLARPRGKQPRDGLLPLFWPELDERRGRSALSQSLYVLRRAVGEETIRSHGNLEVSVDRTILRSDVERFEERLEEGAPGSAFDLYGGELLAGLHVPGCAALGQWLDLERAHVRRMARDAAARAAAVESERSPGSAIGALHRALELFPTDERLFRSLVEVLWKSGDRFGVDRAFAEFRTRLREEVEAEPSEETRVLVERAKGGRRAVTVGASSSGSGREVRSMAVLPLRAPTMESASYSSEAMTEALIGELGKVRSLRVISHQSVLRFRDSRESLAEIAEALGVDALVEGMVAEGGGRIRVTAQLVRAAPEEHIWSGAREAEARDVLAVHRDLARAIAKAVSAAVSQEEQAHLVSPTRVDPAAYEAYLQGWMKHCTAVPQDVARAAELYRKAIRLDPSFAPPWANLGVIYFALMCYGEASPEKMLPLTRDTVDRAFLLDPGLWQGFSARGLLNMAVHDWSAADADMDQAVRIAPNQAMAHVHHSLFLTGVGRFDEAAAAAEAAQRVEPLAPFAHWVGGWASHYAGRPGPAVRQLRRALKLFPDYAMAWLFLAKAHYQAGDWPEAADACRRTLELMPENPMGLGYVTHILVSVGRRAEAEEAMRRFEAERAKRGIACPYYAAAALCGLGRTEDALQELERMPREAAVLGFLLPTDPLLDPLRDDPRFDAVVARVGLEEWPHPAR